MAVAVAAPLINKDMPNSKPLRVCFSYAAYAKNVINHLLSSDIPVHAPLSDSEFSAVEALFAFSFPPDLRSILQEGLPVGAGFPNWRSSSPQQLDILIRLPLIGICKKVAKNYFWIDSWGERPKDIDGAVRLAKGFMKKAPVLVPVYKNFYVPATPCVAGNPVFHVHGGEVRVWSFDLAGFFQRVELGTSGGVPAPAWAATEAREIKLWTELAARGDARGWWSGELGGCLEEVCLRLRDGGWKEEDVREMMMIGGGGCGEAADVEWRVSSMSERLLRAGWSTEDVVELLGSPDDRNGGDDGDYCFDFRRRLSCDDKNHNTISLSF